MELLGRDLKHGPKHLILLVGAFATPQSLRLTLRRSGSAESEQASRTAIRTLRPMGAAASADPSAVVYAFRVVRAEASFASASNSSAAVSSGVSAASTTLRRLAACLKPGSSRTLCNAVRIRSGDASDGRRRPAPWATIRAALSGWSPTSGRHTSGTPCMSALVRLPSPHCVTIAATSGRTAECGTNVSTTAFGGARNAAASRDGPIVTSARTGMPSSASRMRCMTPA